MEYILWTIGVLFVMFLVARLLVGHWIKPKRYKG